MVYLDFDYTLEEFVDILQAAYSMSTTPDKDKFPFYKESYVIDEEKVFVGIEKKLKDFVKRMKMKKNI